MRNNIASFEKTSSSEVKFWAKFNAKIDSTLIFLQIAIKQISQKIILLLIYLLADKSKSLHKIFFVRNSVLVTYLVGEPIE